MTAENASDNGDITIHDLETVMISPDKLLPYENNAKKHPHKQIEHIANSIREFGFNDNVGVWTNDKGEYEIVTGHGTVEAAKMLGLPEIPCDILDHLSDTERRAYCHVHNQTTMETEFDYDTLTDELDNLDAAWEEFGFEDYVYEEEPHQSLTERFGVMPFSVLNARSGEWQERKKAWLALGIRSEEGRGGLLAFKGQRTLDAIKA